LDYFLIPPADPLHAYRLGINRSTEILRCFLQFLSQLIRFSHWSKWLFQVRPLSKISKFKLSCGFIMSPALSICFHTSESLHQPTPSGFKIARLHYDGVPGQDRYQRHWIYRRPVYVASYARTSFIIGFVHDSSSPGMLNY
jgi:hypothetical protein